MRIASLLRLSSKKQARKQADGDLDIPAQRAEVDKFLATRPGWRLVKEYVETSSAYRKGRQDRDVLQEAIRDAFDKKFDALVVWKGDRLSRRIQDFPSIVADLTEDAGVQVWSVVDAPGGKQWSAKNALDLLLLSVEGFKNQSESENISVRVKTRKRQLAQEGHWSGGRAPYGYMLVSQKDAAGEPVLRDGRPIRQLIPDPQTAPVVRQIFERYLAGQGGMNLAGWLNSSGVPSPWGGVWSSNCIRNLLSNKLYAGILVYGRSPMGKKTVEQSIEAPGAHEPIITLEMWEQANQLRTHRAQLHPRQHQATYVLTGILRCGLCGSPVGAAKWNYYLKNGERRSTYGYRCMRWIQSKACTTTWYRQAETDEAVLNALVDQFTMPSQLRTFLEERESASKASMAAQQATRRQGMERLKQIEAALKRLDRAYFEAGTISDTEYVQKKAEYQEERQHLEAQLAQPVGRDPAKSLEQLTTAVAELRVNWPYLTATEQKTLLLNMTRAWELAVLIHEDKRVEIRPVNEEGA